MQEHSNTGLASESCIPHRVRRPCGNNCYHHQFLYVSEILKLQFSEWSISINSNNNLQEHGDINFNVNVNQHITDKKALKFAYVEQLNVQLNVNLLSRSYEPGICQIIEICHHGGLWHVVDINLEDTAETTD